MNHLNYDLEAIFTDVRNELDEAAQKWGSEFDGLNTLNDWATYISIYVGQAASMANKDDPHEVYRQLIKAMGLCASAAGHVVEELIAPRHYDTTLGNAQSRHAVERLANAVRGGILEAYKVSTEDQVSHHGVGDVQIDSEVMTRLRAAVDSAERIEEARYVEADISDEDVRCYEFGTGVDRYRHLIRSPQTLVYRHGGSTHRVIDADGVVHCIPAPGHQACVLTWTPKDPSNPIQF